MEEVDETSMDTPVIKPADGWEEKQRLAEQLPEPSSVAQAVSMVLQAFYFELEEWEGEHSRDQDYCVVPFATLLLNSSNRLPAELSEIVRSAQWLRSEVDWQDWRLDENLRTSTSKTP